MKTSNLGSSNIPLERLLDKSVVCISIQLTVIGKKRFRLWLAEKLLHWASSLAKGGLRVSCSLDKRSA